MPTRREKAGRPTDWYPLGIDEAPVLGGQRCQQAVRREHAPLAHGARLLHALGAPCGVLLLVGGHRLRAQHEAGERRWMQETAACRHTQCSVRRVSINMV